MTVLLADKQEPQRKINGIISHRPYIISSIIHLFDLLKKLPIL